MTAAKVDEFQPFPVKIQLPGVDVCVSSSPPWGSILFSWISSNHIPFV